MSKEPPVGISVKGLDHVHIHVANRERAAEWFRRVLGLEPIDRKPTNEDTFPGLEQISLVAVK